MPKKSIGEFSVSFIQVVDEHGNVDRELEPQAAPEDLLRLYRVMLLAREADGRALKLQRQGRIGTFAPGTGQEAVSAGAALAMSEKDWFVPAFRELAGMLLRGWPLSNFFLYYNGFEEGNRMPEGSRVLPISIPVASQLLHATGIGYALKYRGEKDAAVVAFCGDGGTSEGDFHEALNFAGVWKVPVVFIIQNNQWAISTPVARQTSSLTLAQKAVAYGIPGVQVDGNDALAVYRTVGEALAAARGGAGPTLVEAVTYRLLMHTTADDPSRYRDEKEVQAWEKRDPLPRLALYLEGKGILNEKLRAEIEQEVARDVETAVKDFEAASGFKTDAPFDHVFGTSHGIIEEQRALFLGGPPDGG